MLVARSRQPARFCGSKGSWLVEQVNSFRVENHYRLGNGGFILIFLGYFFRSGLELSVDDILDLLLGYFIVWVLLIVAKELQHREHLSECHFSGLWLPVVIKYFLDDVGVDVMLINLVNQFFIHFYVDV